MGNHGQTKTLGRKLGTKLTQAMQEWYSIRYDNYKRLCSLRKNRTSVRVCCTSALSCTSFKPSAKDKTWHIWQPMVWIYLIYLYEVAWYWCSAFTSLICMKLHEYEIVYISSLDMTLHKCSCMFIYISMNLLYSTKLRGQKQKQNEASTLWLSWFISATAKQQWFPFVHTLSGSKLPGVSCMIF